MISEIFKLRDAGYKFIRINYSGSGDSGQIDDIEVSTDGKDYDDIDGSYNKDEIENYCYRALLEDIEDWYNNDGGYGHIYINLTNLDYEIENHIRIETYEDYHHSGTLEFPNNEL